MKITGIILIIMGALSTLGSIAQAMSSGSFSGVGIGFIVLGFFLISRAKKKKEEEEKKKEWIDEKPE